jgi:hypothetical protein
MQLDAIFFLTIPGPKMIWQFGEMGYDVSIDFNGRLGPKPIRWNYLDDNLRKYLVDFYGALIKLRKEHPTFETAGFNLYVTSATKRIVLNHNEMNVVIIGNFDVIDAQMQFSFPALGTYYNYFTGDSLVVDEVTETIDLQPGEYRMYTSIRLETPQIGTGIWDSKAVGREDGRILVYPNPGSGIFNFEFLILNSGNIFHSGSPVLEIWDEYGRKAGSYRIPSLQQEFHLDISGWADGIYLVRLKSDENTVAKCKFIKVSR